MKFSVKILDYSTVDGKMLKNELCGALGLIFRILVRFFEFFENFGEIILSSTIIMEEMIG